MKEQAYINSGSEINYNQREHWGFKQRQTGMDEMFVIRNTEDKLLDSIRQGDQEALGKLYSHYIDSLFSYGQGLSSDRDHVMDCIHDLFVDLYKYRKGLAKVDDMKMYLFISLKRKIIKKYNRKIIPVSGTHANSNIEDYNTCSDSYEEELINSENDHERSKKLNKALASLTDKQRTGLLLRFNEQRSYKEISEIMDVSIESARTAIYRALKSFKQ